MLYGNACIQCYRKHFQKLYEQEVYEYKPNIGYFQPLCSPYFEGDPRKDEYIKPIMQYKNIPTGVDAI